MKHSAALWHRGVTDRVVLMTVHTKEFDVWMGPAGLQDPDSVIGMLPEDCVCFASAPWRRDRVRQLPKRMQSPDPTDLVALTDHTTRALYGPYADCVGFLMAALKVTSGGWKIRTMSNDRNLTTPFLVMSKETTDALSLGTLRSTLFPTSTVGGANVLDEWLAYPLRELQRIQQRQRAIAALLTGPYRELSALIQTPPKQTRFSTLADVSQEYQYYLRVQRVVRLASQQWRSNVGEIPPIGLLRHALRHLAPWKQAVSRRLTVSEPDGELRPAWGGELSECWDRTAKAKQRLEDGVKKEARHWKCTRAYEWVHDRVVLLLQKEQVRTTVPLGLVLGNGRRGTIRWAPTSLQPLAHAVRAAEGAAAEAATAVVEALADETEPYAEMLTALRSQMAELDALAALAQGADVNGFSRPKVGTTCFHLRGAKHPLVPNCVPQDLRLNEGETSICITGANTAGKSTTMRTLQVLVVLAQAGSFVPAEYAEVPMYDRLCFRRGTDDAQLAGLSSFVAQMVETAAILRCSGPNTLVCFDELGAATAVAEGCSLAQAILEDLRDKGCTVVLSTHFERLPSQCSVQIAVRQDHRLQRGVARSDALETARRLGLCEGVLQQC